MKTYFTFMKESHTLYHKSYTDAVNAALQKHSDLKVSPEDRDTHIAMGPRKPAEGETVKHHIPATDKNGDKHIIHIQVYNKGGNKPFELNTYSSKKGVSFSSVSKKKVAEELTSTLGNVVNRIKPVAIGAAKLAVKKVVKPAAKHVFNVVKHGVMRSILEDPTEMRHSSDVIGDPNGLKAYVDSLPKNHIDRDDLLTAASHMAFGNEKHLAQHVKALDTDVRDKVKEYLPPKFKKRHLEEADQIHEEHMSEKDAERLAQKHVNAAISAKKAGDLKGHAAHAEASNDIRDMILKHTDSAKGIPSGKIRLTAKKLFGESADQIDEAHKMAKISTTKDIGHRVVKVGPGQTETEIDTYNYPTNLGGGKGPIGGKYGMPTGTGTTNPVTRAIAAAKAAKQKKQAQQANRLTKEEVEQIDKANSHSEVANLKSKGKHHEAGQHAAKSGHLRQYGPHFGMRSDKEEAQRQFLKGYDSVKKTNEEVDQIDEISKKKIGDYSQGASAEIVGNQPADKDKLRKRTNREKFIKLAYNKYHGYKVKVPATIKEEEIDEMRSALIPHDHEEAKEMTPAEKKARYDSYVKTAKHHGKRKLEPSLTDGQRMASSAVHTAARMAAAEWKNKYMKEESVNLAEISAALARRASRAGMDE